MNGEDLLPAWAVELTKQIAVLNEKIPSHVDWVERNMKDHETRLRELEASKAERTAIERIQDRVDVLEANADRSAWAGRIGWLVLGAAAAAIATIIITRLLAG